MNSSRSKTNRKKGHTNNVDLSTSLKQENLREYLQGSVNNRQVAEAIFSRDAETAGRVMTDHVVGALSLYERGITEKDGDTKPRLARSPKQPRNKGA